MTPEEILAHPPGVLSQAQRESFFEAGYLVLERIIDDGWLDRLRGAMAEMIEESRETEASNDSFVLEPAHKADAPRLRRLNRAADHHPVFWEYASESILPDIVADLVGPDVKFRESMLNFKWAGGGDPVEWHQDLAFYPHTNRTPLITLLCLEDVTPEMGPLKVIPGSHERELFDHHDDAGRWAGGVSARDLARAGVESAVSLPAPAGTLIVIHGWVIHGSERNLSDRCRPLLICGYSAADAFSYTPLGNVSRYTWEIVRGQPAKYSHHEPLRLRVPPDWSQGYTSIFEDQKDETRESPAGA